MKKILNFIYDNILFIETLILLIVIPLFPKIPIVDVKNTWVYVRTEDFLVVFVLLSWVILLLKEKITLKTPLTLPILIFWIIGGLSTMHGILLVFPTIANVFPNVAFLSLVRHVEYMSLFFIAYQGFKEKPRLPIVIGVIILTLLGVIFYGFGQKYLGFPAYLTMNEEFAKGIPIQLSGLSRVSSTFAGHYDLAAYLVLIIPLVASLFFGFKNWLIKIITVVTSVLGLVVLFWTVSRVSFLVLFVSLFIVLFFHKKKLVLIILPLTVIFAFAFLSYQPSLLDRFKSTVATVDVLVDAKTGDSVGHVKFVPKDYFKDKIVLQKRVANEEELVGAITGDPDTLKSSESALLAYEFIPQSVPLVLATNVSNGESLPQGTGYINLTLSPVTNRLGNFFYELPENIEATFSAQVLVLHGDFIVKKAAAYDLSFTTRFQGEWPRTFAAFMRNIFLGSGYGSVSLAVDNNYLRMLGEIGMFGFLAFFGIFISFGIYVKNAYKNIDSPLVKSFVVGFIAGTVGLFLNATLIDVFEASKIAFVLWTLIGITLALVMQYQGKEISLKEEFIKISTSHVAIAVYLLGFALILYSPMLSNFFIGDDFTWLRWASDCGGDCSLIGRIINFFVNSNGFFYRPGTKLYFYIFESVFWLNPFVYHAFSLVMHFAVAVLFYFLSLKLYKNKLMSAVAAFLFLIIAGYSEAVFWIASIGQVVSSFFALLTLLSFIKYFESKKIIYYLLSLLFIIGSLMFHEMGVIVPFLILSYQAKDGFTQALKNFFTKKEYLALFFPILGYLAIRFIAHSHWFNGDYSYDLVKLPFNIIGNVFGYLMLILVGQDTVAIYNVLRNLFRANLIVAIILGLILLSAVVLIYIRKIKLFRGEDRRIVIFGSLFFIASLITYLGLGNIASRYSYLASLGVIIIFVYYIKKFYDTLRKTGKEIALLTVTIFILIYSLFQIIQIQQAYFDWAGAGQKVENFFISLDAQYTNFWSQDKVEFHFVNVPIKSGDAWVFPVGLEDATWFAFKNPQARIYTYPTAADAVHNAGLDFNKIVLQFNDDGSVRQIDKTLGN